MLTKKTKNKNKQKGKTKMKNVLLVVSILAAIYLPSFVSASIESMGDQGQYGLVVLPLLTSLIKGIMRGLKEYGWGFSVGNSTVYALKYGIDAERPYGGGCGMPSGHTFASFLSATYLWERYGWEWGVPATLVAGFVGYSRVESENHSWDQVLAGAGIGVAMGVLFTSKLEIPEEFPIIGGEEGEILVSPTESGGFRALFRIIF